ncbi:alpha/beta fold hydrolase [Nonomuraea sp. NPDC047897]|uniref:alpha/beta fold hydrolase n=1 Tax=Nonomuraea sp. NPDC047897 TaxID=3364346 RepID=UPI00372053CF
MKKTLLTFVLCATALAGCGSAEDPAKPAAEPSAKGADRPADRPAKDAGTVAWSTCEGLTGPDGKPAAPDPSVQCGTIKVPLDYAKPDGDQIDLALIRIKATTDDRLGSLVFNFGGPGGSGVDTLVIAAKAFAGLGTRYDLVSFDPRGVDRSAGVKCGGQVERLLNATSTADGEKLTKQFTAACAKDSGKVLPHVGTVNAAKDLERLRVALGDDKLNYFGLSYGTHLGAVYATHFPTNVGRFVLDSAYDPTVTFEERAVTQATGFATSFEAFAADCVKQGCDLGKTPAEVKENVEELVEGLKTKPLKVGSRTLTHGLGQLAVITPLYAKASWPALEQAAASAIKGDGSTLLMLADSYTGRKPDGTYSTMMTSLQAITCVDSAERPSRAEAAAINDKVEKAFPILATDSPVITCSHWPARGDDAASKIDATGSAPIVVIGGKGDPATPYQWAVSLNKQLKTGVLVTYEGEGHGAYLSGSSCVMRLVDTYVLSGKVPAANTSCPAA